ncbi:hypothetical protein PENTCL1PPCAC_4265 [Pristionchus entomophagus]|uniref:Uncharacterized protein n=1 Tax=Pristionchus entomophagus TaxID=358040 RepID=A0AAV5SI36_9BILA|nr:hypothetical protein PENTCL1PPCAC_4265 [Pristionchus entomophagus]
MNWHFLRGTGRGGPHRVPSNYFGDYFSAGFSAAPQDAWVTGRFSGIDENILFIGSDTGHVCVVDVDVAPDSQADAFKYYFCAHRGVVMDVIPVPGNREELLTMSGSDIRIWTLGQPIKSSLFWGHEKSVRAASFVPDSSNLFATGGRDGSILMWDRRVAPIAQSFNPPGEVQMTQVYRRPLKGYHNCHLVKPHPPSSVAGGRRRSERNAPTNNTAAPSITSMTYLDEHTIITSSASAKSGIRLWDTRRAPVNKESRPLAVLELPSMTSRDVGVSSICLDRFKSSLFAVSTDNCIYEFNPNSGRTKPVCSYVGANIGGDFYIQAACSPISDHIMCGSGDKCALVWDAQKFHSYADQPATGPATANPIGIRPSLSLGGHNKKVSAVGYSANAMYMFTMDDEDFRVWRHMPVSRSSLKDAEENMGAAFERVEKVELPKEDKASDVLQSFSITPGPRLFLSPTKAGMAPLQKRKEPFASPFKPRASLRLFDEKENIPPGMKVSKLDGVSLPWLEEDREQEERRKEEERRKREELRRNPFYYKHPTMHLPNLVYERYVEQLRDEGKKPVETETVTKSGRKVRTLECWARSSAGRLSKESLPSIDEFPDSACAQMISTATAPGASPRKLQLRQHGVAAQTGPTAAAAAAASMPKGRRSSVRNILHYFQTNKTADNV